jgi:hypothetical protein
MHERQQRLETLRAGFDLVLRDADGRGGSVEGALILRRPGHARIKAWRFHHELLDLTRRPDGTWLWTAEKAEGLERALRGAQARRPLGFQAMLTLPPPEQTELVREGGNGRPMVIRWSFGEEKRYRVEATVDRPTLTMRRLRIRNEKGALVKRIALSDHAPVNGLVFPHHIESRGERTLSLRLRDIAINEALPAGAFDPPAKAEQIR